MTTAFDVNNVWVNPLYSQLVTIGRTVIGCLLRVLAQLLLWLASKCDDNENKPGNDGPVKQASLTEHQQTTYLLASNKISHIAECQLVDEGIVTTMDDVVDVAILDGAVDVTTTIDDGEALDDLDYVHPPIDVSCRLRCDSLNSCCSVDSGTGEELLTDAAAEACGGFDEDTGLPVFTLDDVADHCCVTDAWTVVYDRIYDVTDYLHRHPGGEGVLMEYVGHDATNAFRSVGHSRAAFAALDKYCVGILTQSERLNYESEY